MNEFTKEELIDLNVILNVWIVKNPKDTRTRQMQLKAEFMIDSFPEDDEHEIICTYEKPPLRECDLKYAAKMQELLLSALTCKHESDGEDYRYQCSHHYKCKKCGEFYR